MSRRRHANLVLAGVLSIILTSQAVAEDGKADLESAMDLKVQASNLQQLGEVVKLCEQAIEKGLNADDELFAVQLLTGSLYQSCKPQVELLVKAQPFPPELDGRRKEVLKDLRKILKYDDKMGYAHLMIAQLEGLRGGDREAARKAADRAVKLLQEDKGALAEALLVRGQLQEDEEARMADFERAVELSPENPKVWQTRAFYFLTQGKVEEAVEDFNNLLERDSDNLLAHMAVAETLMKLEKIDEAMEHVDHVLEVKPNAVALRFRAQLWSVQERFDKALADIEAAIKLAPNDLQLYLLRARLYYLDDRNALAKTDVERVLQRVPDFAPALELRGSILAAMGQFDEAIENTEKLRKADPDNLLYEIQLAVYHNAAGHYQQAVEIYSNVLQADPGNSVAIRGRGDAYLNLGAHKEAVDDYNAALEGADDDSGILNNFAWVLATSPEDALRDGKRALKLAKKACELTDYQQAHILSTLAAAYAEMGDFQKAIEWSQKACEMSEDDIKVQLEEELESYQQQKPWREKKPQVEGEGEVPADAVDSNTPPDDEKSDDKKSNGE